MGFVPIDSGFTITETSSQLCKFTMSDFEFGHFIVFYHSNSFLRCIEFFNFCVISRAKYIRLGLCVSVWMGEKKQ